VKVDTAFVAYYGGISYDNQPHAKPDHKPEWLKKSIENLKELAERVIINVCLPKDKTLAEGLVGADNVLYHSDKFDPLLLTARACKRVQQMKLSGTIMYAETDQHFSFNSPGSLDNNLWVVNTYKDRYVIPWTYEDTMFMDGVWWACRHAQFFVKHPVTGNPCQITNASFPETLQHANQFWFNNDFYTVPVIRDERQGAPHPTDERSRCESFGASFICHTELFNSVKFSEGRPDPLERPLFDLFVQGKCTKPIKWNDFTRYHFGGGADHIERCNCQHPINDNDQRWLD
jgi:hypothetical protein